jgi:hypothetical protein
MALSTQQTEHKSEVPVQQDHTNVTGISTLHTGLRVLFFIFRENINVPVKEGRKQAICNTG